MEGKGLCKQKAVAEKVPKWKRSDEYKLKT